MTRRWLSKTFGKRTRGKKRVSPLRWLERWRVKFTGTHAAVNRLFGVAGLGFGPWSGVWAVVVVWYEFRAKSYGVSVRNETDGLYQSFKLSADHKVSTRGTMIEMEMTTTAATHFLERKMTLMLPASIYHGKKPIPKGESKEGTGRLTWANEGPLAEAAEVGKCVLSDRSNKFSNFDSSRALHAFVLAFVGATVIGNLLAPPALSFLPLDLDARRNVIGLRPRITPSLKASRDQRLYGHMPRFVPSEVRINPIQSCKAAVPKHRAVYYGKGPIKAIGSLRILDNASERIYLSGYNNRDNAYPWLQTRTYELGWEDRHRAP
ncbi:hypothetical protein EDB89DRAFT_1913647 [Lactarius sanguifluus]|nr:hypothetical protein EDB89DRAFT_1913647 [Lactarius sanguifluus]